MQIALVNTEAHRGGASKMAVTLTQALAGLGVDASLYHTSDNQKLPLLVGLRKRGSRQLNALLARLSGGLAVYDFGVAKEILAYTAQADVLHIHNLHGYYLNYQELLLGWQNRPIIWSWHDQWPVTGRCGTPDINCQNWQTGCGSCHWQQLYPATWLDLSAQEYRLKTRLYNSLKKLRIITASEFLRQKAIQRGFSPDKVQVIPNPLPLDNFKLQTSQQARLQLGLPQNQPVLLFVAANCNDPRKGYADFERLVSQLQVAAVVVGKPPAQRSPLIHYAGLIADPDLMAAYYMAADLMIMTTQADNYPNVIIEAMACGTAVLSYDVGGIPDQMPVFWDGLIPVNDLTALMQRCQTILADLPALHALREPFRAFALSNWQPEAVARQYIAAYQSVMSVL